MAANEKQLTLSQIRTEIYAILQYAYQGDWDQVIDCAENVLNLAKHAKQITERDER